MPGLHEKETISIQNNINASETNIIVNTSYLYDDNDLGILNRLAPQCDKNGVKFTYAPNVKIKELFMLQWDLDADTSIFPGKYLIQLDTGGHWVGIVLEKTGDLKYKITYMDSASPKSNMPDHLKKEFAEILRIPQENIHFDIYEHCWKQKGVSCGAFAYENSIRYALGAQAESNPGQVALRKKHIIMISNDKIPMLGGIPFVDKQNGIMRPTHKKSEVVKIAETTINVQNKSENPNVSKAIEKAKQLGLNSLNYIKELDILDNLLDLRNLYKLEDKQLEKLYKFAMLDISINQTEGDKQPGLVYIKLDKTNKEGKLLDRNEMIKDLKYTLSERNEPLNDLQIKLIKLRKMEEQYASLTARRSNLKLDIPNDELPLYKGVFDDINKTIIEVEKIKSKLEKEIFEKEIDIIRYNSIKRVTSVIVIAGVIVGGGLYIASNPAFLATITTQGSNIFTSIWNLPYYGTLYQGVSYISTILSDYGINAQIVNHMINSTIHNIKNFSTQMQVASAANFLAAEDAKISLVLHNIQGYFINNSMSKLLAGISCVAADAKIGIPVLGSGLIISAILKATTWDRAPQPAL